MFHPPFETAPAFGAVSHGFFSRVGGVSSGVYTSLNGGPGSKDDPAHVTENRRRVARALGGEALVSLYQVHGGTVVEASADWGDARPQADGIVCRTPGLVIGILTADCCPVLFADPKAGVIGAAHAGWRGAVAGVTDATIDAMVDLGAVRARITAALGPTIYQHSYEVGDDMRRQALDADDATKGFFKQGKDGTHYQFDLPGYVAHRVARAGLDAPWVSPVDTYSSDDHFSYRRTTHQAEADYGRQISAIRL